MTLLSGSQIKSKNKINQNLPIDLNYDDYYSSYPAEPPFYRAMKPSLSIQRKSDGIPCQENFISRASAMRHLQSLADYVQEFDVISKSELLKNWLNLLRHYIFKLSFVGKKKFRSAGITTSGLHKVTM